MILINEIIDMTVSSLVLGYVFKDLVIAPKKYPEVYMNQENNLKKEIKETLISAAILAPALILHEMGHMFTAMAFGATATYHAAYLWLGIALLLKLIRSPFIFFIPAYTRIIGNLTWMQSAGVAFAGPFVNLLLFLATKWIKTKRFQKEINIFSAVNLFLFVFNMIPIPGFDGFTVLSGLIHAFF